MTPRPLTNSWNVCFLSIIPLLTASGVCLGLIIRAQSFRRKNDRPRGSAIALARLDGSEDGTICDFYILLDTLHDDDAS